MKEKKVIDYTRTYRRIEADKKKCILYIVILRLLGFLLMWTQIDDLDTFSFATTLSTRISYSLSPDSIAFFARITGSGQDKPLASTFFIRLSLLLECV